MSVHHHRRNSYFKRPPWPNRTTFSEHQRILVATFSALCAVSLISLATYSIWSLRQDHLIQDVQNGNAPEYLAPLNESALTYEFCANYFTETDSLEGFLQTVSDKHLAAKISLPDPLHSINFLKGPPTPRFRDNLLNDTKYISSWTGAGWTNDVMTFANLIYLGKITDRVPIVPKFTKNGIHIRSDSPPISFGEIFDLPYLRKATGTPIVEWHEVKNEESTELEELGCWSIWATVSPEKNPRPSDAPAVIYADVSYTDTPWYTKMKPNNPADYHSTFWSLATLAYPMTRAENLGEPRLSPHNELQIHPDEHLLCFDYMYYVGAHQPHEISLDYSPAWNQVLQHMRWTDRMLLVANGYIRRALHVLSDEPTPPWIAVHIRRHDFDALCEETPLEDCYAPLSAFERRVHEVKQELLQRKGIDVKHVLMTSDEKNPQWWADVAALGWSWVDFSEERTEEVYNSWYPTLIDAVLQSSAAGFVGTDHSTMSLIAGRRVETWHQGVVRTVKWGWPGADDH